MEINHKEYYSCICMTCGVRNDHSTESGFCQNGHDDWLEYRDVYWDNEHAKRAQKLFNLSAYELELKFRDKNIKQLKIWKH